MEQQVAFTALVVFEFSEQRSSIVPLCGLSLHSLFLLSYKLPTYAHTCVFVCPGGAVSGGALTSAPPWANIHTSVWHVQRNVVTPVRELSLWNGMQGFVQDHCSTPWIQYSTFFFFIYIYSLSIENNLAKLPVVTSVPGSVQQATSVLLHLSHPVLLSQAVQMANDFYKPFFPPSSHSEHCDLATVEL